MNTTEGEDHLEDQELTLLSVVITLTDISIIFISVFIYFSYELIRCVQYILEDRSEEVDIKEDDSSSSSNQVTESEGSGEVVSSEESDYLYFAKDYDMMNFLGSHCNDPKGLVYLFLYRCFVFLWIFLSFILNEYSRILDFDASFILYFRYLTHTTFFLAYVYYGVIVFVTIVFYFDVFFPLRSSSRGLRLFFREYVLSPILFFMYVLFEMAVTFSFCVVVLFWCLQTPYYYIIGEGDRLSYDYGTFSVHFLSFLFLFIELIFLSRCRFHYLHAILFFDFCFVYLLWTTFLVKFHLIDEYPYNGLLSYDTDPLVALPVRFGASIAGGFMFLVFSVITNTRNAFVRKVYEGIYKKLKKIFFRRRVGKLFQEYISEEIVDDEDDEDIMNGEFDIFNQGKNPIQSREISISFLASYQSPNSKEQQKEKEKEKKKKKS